MSDSDKPVIVSGNLQETIALLKECGCYDFIAELSASMNTRFRAVHVICADGRKAHYRWDRDPPPPRPNDPIPKPAPKALWPYPRKKP